MHAAGGLPRLEAHAGDRRAGGSRPSQRHAPLVAGDDVALGIGAFELHLQALDRTVDEAHRAAERTSLAHHVPGLERLVERQRQALVLRLTAEREAELELRGEPFRLEVEAVRLEVGEHVEEVGPHEMRQHEAVVQRRAPAHEFAVERRRPEARDERPHQQLLREVHARIGRHLEAAEFDEAQPAGRPIGRVELVDADLAAVRVARDVDEQVAEQPIDQPGQRRLALSRRGHLPKRDLELIERVVPCFVDARRLRRRADEQPREQIAQRGMMLPVQHQRFEQIGAPQERRV